MSGSKARVLGAALAALLVAGILAAGRPEAPISGEKLRVGTFNSRSVALAYGRSELFNGQIKKLKADHQRAKEAGDEARVKELEEKGKLQQNLRHMQVFGEAPIADILAQIQDAIKVEAQKAGVDLIVRDVDIAYRGPAVELVDLTDAMVQMFKPTEATLKMAKEIGSHPPVPLEKFPIENE